MLRVVLWMLVIPELSQSRDFVFVARMRALIYAALLNILKRKHRKGKDSNAFYDY